MIANYVVKDGKSNWLEGMVLVCMCVQYRYRARHFTAHDHSHFLAYKCFSGIYAIFALTFWFYPGSDIPQELLGCGS